MISVIIPVYNAAPFLEEAIASVISQSVADREIILVDDGSTDASPGICDRAAAADPRVCVIHKPNGGLSDARNAGLDTARGEWIAFLDADDALAPGALARMLDAALATGADVVAADIVRSPDASLPPGLKPRYREETLPPDEAVERMLYQRGLNNSACGKLYAARLWQGLRFRRGVWYEDLDVFYRVMERAGKVAAIPDALYVYRENPASFTRRFSEARADVLDVCDRMVEYMRASSPALLPAALDRRLSAAFNIYGLLAANPDAIPTKRDGIARRCMNIILSQRRRSLTDPKVRLKNKLGILATYLGGFPLLRLLSRRAYR